MTVGLIVTPTGASAPSYEEILSYISTAMRTIFGQDLYIDPDSQDGQMLAIFAQAISDCNDAGLALYNAFSPATAIGAGLSSLVKINGLRRLSPSNSSCTVVITGQAGTVIANGLIGDNQNLGTQWALPPNVVIPAVGGLQPAGQLQVTATCTTQGAVQAAIGTLTTILTPVPGWQSVTNQVAATIGAPVETDPQLRARQALSTALPALTTLESMYDQIANLPGVQRVQVYENDTNLVDANGNPPHSVAPVVSGGAITDICNAIAKVKAPGVQTVGTISEVVVDAFGVPNTISFYPLIIKNIEVVVSITPLEGFSLATAALISASVAKFINSMAIGEAVYLLRLVGPANLMGDAATGSSGQTQTQLDAISATFTVTSITQAFSGNTQLVQDLIIPFTGAAACVAAAVTVNVL